ncbi:hypothetical protein MUK42_06527 [Musa troglodytarum]|uniref:Transmembrane protein 194 n=1 Tax=Musa troglodytarum TaxID=320322 RepID=A0A9E7KXM0_9LILI|nr:hypothetical protein MUK42_06527 [Musa troglodytarum]
MAMKGTTFFPSSLLLLLLLLPVASPLILSLSETLLATNLLFVAEINLENPVLEFGSPPYAGQSCHRVRLTGMSRLNLKSYASSVRVALKISDSGDERLGRNIRLCFHRNVSIGACQCEVSQLESFLGNERNSMISPYESGFVDVKINKETSTFFSVALEEGKLMKLVPTRRRNIIYITFSASLLGLSSLIRNYFSTVITFLLVSCGFSEESYNLVSLVLLGGIIFAGTFLGYWFARKFVLSEDGCVDSGIAQFVKWTMRLVGIVSILQSTIDVPLGLLALATCWTCSYLVHSKKWRRRSNKNGSLWQRRSKQASSDRQPENLSFASQGTRRSFWGGSTSYSPTPNAGVFLFLHVSYLQKRKGCSFSKRVKQRDQDYYSTYHNVPRRKFSEEEWEKFTRQSTSAALAEWASTPEVIKWIGNNAHRMRLIEEDNNLDDTFESDSSEETVPRNESAPSFSTWL